MNLSQPWKQQPSWTRSLVLAAALGALGALSALVSTARGAGDSYSVQAEPLGDGSTLVYVDLADPNLNYTAYKQENDARIAAWVADPAAAPAVDGQTVLLTFRRPQSYDQTLRLLAPHAAGTGAQLGVPPWEFHLAGRKSVDRTLVYMKSLRDFDPGIIGRPQLPSPETCAASPVDCQGAVYAGIIAVAFPVAGGPGALAALRDLPEVFLVDTTGIQLRHDLSLTDPAAAGRIQLISLPEPEQDDRHGHVGIP